MFARMPLSHLPAGATIDLQGSTVIVVVPLYGAHDMFVRCFNSLLKHTPVSAPILIADDCGPDPASQAWVEGLAASGLLDHRVIWMRQPENLGFVGNCNAAFAAAGRADVVLVNSDVEVAEHWLEDLGAAAHSDSLVATATTLTNHGTIVSVPHRNRPQPSLPQEVTFEQAAAAVRANSQQLRPLLPTAVGHCVYVRRSALDLVGEFDEAFAPGYGEEADFSQRCIMRGLRHVVADDVLTLHHGQASFGVDGRRNPRQDAHERVLRSRYPFYVASVDLVAGDEAGPLARALDLARQAILGFCVTIDGRCLGPTMTGTQVHTLELIAALHRSRAVQLRVVVPAGLGEVAAKFIADAGDIETVTVEQALAGARIDDIVHRPYQISEASDLRLLAQLGRRVTVTHQDLIAFHNPSYFASAKDWIAHRQLTRESLALADHVLFFSEHARQDALGEELVPEHRASVVHIGVDHTLVTSADGQEPPAEASELTTSPFLLVLGTNFRHKNRVFALELFKELRERHGWQGKLVFAGPSVAHGASTGDEAQWLAAHPGYAEHLVTLPAVGDRVKDWLVEQAKAVLYPTTFEGFGLLPFEAAQAGTPCLFAHVTSLSELLSSVPAPLVPWDPVSSAERALPLLTDPAAAQAQVDAICAVTRRLTWDATASQMIGIYREIVTTRARDARSFVGDSLVKDARYWGLRHDIGPTGLALVAPDEPLLPLNEQRAVAGLTRRRLTRGPFLATLRLAQRLTPKGRSELRSDNDDADECAA